MEKGRVLFYTPEALVTPHLGCQCILARTLKELGHDVVFARCFGSLTRCPSKDMVAAPFEIGGEAVQDVCHRCITASFGLLSHYQLDSLVLGDYLSQDKLEEIHQTIFQHQHDLSAMTYDGIEFGKICTRDLSLATKICDFKNIDPANQTAWVLYIHGCLSSYAAVDRIIKERGISHVVRFNEYATNIGAAFAAYKNNVPVITTSQASHLGVDRRLIVIMSELGPFTHRSQMRDWPQWEHLALSAAQVKKVADDVISRCGATSAHVYSSAKTVNQSNIIQDLNLSFARKTIVAFTSSIDEDISYRLVFDALGKPLPLINKPFTDQMEWLTELTAYVESHPELQLIVRVHPREGKNHRESFGSQHLGLLKAQFGGTFERCRFVWPESKISSYDLVELADLGLTSWSSLGLEMARLGVPVLTAWHDVAYPDGDHLPWGGETKQNYFRMIGELLEKRVDINHLAKAFRCYHQFHVMKALDLSDVVPNQEDSGAVHFRMPSEARAIEEIIIGNKPLREINLERMRAQQSPELVGQEDAEIRAELLRLVHYFLTGEKDRGDSQMSIYDCGELPKGSLGYELVKNAAARGSVICVEGKTVNYRLTGKQVFKYSPLVARLALYLKPYFSGHIPASRKEAAEEVTHCSASTLP